MKKSRFTDSQIIEALKRVEAGLAVPEICRELGIEPPRGGSARRAIATLARQTPRTRESPTGCYA